MSEEVIQKLQEHNKRFDHLDNQMDFLVKKVLEHDNQVDFLVKKVLEHDEQLIRIEDNMATKSDIRDMTNTLDMLVKLAQKEDQELTFMGNRVSKIEDDVKQIKPLVGLATT